MKGVHAVYPPIFPAYTVFTVATHGKYRMTRTFNLSYLQVIYYIRYLPCQHTVNTVWQELAIYPTYKIFTAYGIHRVNTRLIPTQLIFIIVIYLNGNVLGI